MKLEQTGLNRTVKTRTKVILGSLALAIVFGPFLVPVQSSGKLNVEQAIAEVPGLEPNFIQVLDHRVHYEIAGSESSDRLILLLHGFGASSFSWEKVIDPLAQDALVVAYDRAGFGFSERPEYWGKAVNPYSSEGQSQVIDAFIEKFGKGKEIVLIGHSAGGLLAADYAISNPRNVDRLVLFAPAIGLGGGENPLGFLFQIPQINYLGPALVSSISTSGLQILYDSYYDQNLITDETVNGYTAPLKIIGWEKGFWEFVKAPRNADLELGKLSVPTLIITGDSDKIVPTENSVNLAQQLSNIAQLVVVPKSGHLTNEENPKEFVAAVNDFLD